MRRSFAFALFIVVVAMACNRQKTCYADNYKVGISIGFKGYNAGDLDTLIVRKYTAGAGFSQLLRTDSISPSTINFSNDTAFSTNGSGFVVVDGGTDYEIIVPAAMREYRITNINYRGPEVITYNSGDDGRCAHHGIFYNSAYTAAVDGIPTSPMGVRGPSGYIFLVK